jgi:hypothetical protein
MFFKYFCLFTIDSTSTPEVLRHEPKVRLVGGRDRSSGRLEIKLPPDTLYHPVCSPGTTISSTNETDCHNITEILLKVVLNTINQSIKMMIVWLS